MTLLLYKSLRLIKRKEKKKKYEGSIFPEVKISLFLLTLTFKNMDVVG